MCDECGFDWHADRADVVATIARLGPAYRARVGEALDGHSDIRSRPAAGVWSILEYTAHMRDVAAFYLDRIDRVLSVERPQMRAVGFSSLADERRYNDDDIETVLAALDDHATHVANVLRSLLDEQWRRVGIGSAGDERSVLVLARRLAHDGHHHLLDVARVARAVGRGRDPKTHRQSG